MENLGPRLFSKVLSDTDARLRLHWPTRHANLLPAFGDNRQVSFSVRDSQGTRWDFRCTRRSRGYEKHVISSGWVPFVNSKHGLHAGDEVIFYRNLGDDRALFVVTVKRNISLFGRNINDVEE